MSASAYMGLYYFCLTWAAVYAALVVWTMQSYVRSSFAAQWPLKLLRTIGSTSATIAFIPIFSVLMSGFTCGGERALARNVRART